MYIRKKKIYHVKNNKKTIKALLTSEKVEFMARTSQT